MPNYRLEDNPPSIFPGKEIADLVAAAPTWWLVATPYNHEKSVAWHFLETGTPYYLPMIKRRDEWRRANLIPLFPRYLFAAPPVGADIRCKLFLADMVHEEWRLVRELVALEEGIQAGTIKSASDIEPGDLCRVTDGAFRDYEGNVCRIDHRRNFGYLSGLIKNTEIEFPLEYLEAVS